MYCTKCGKQIDDGANFCTGCGQPVEDVPQAPGQGGSAENGQGQRERVCANCGAPLAEGNLFCTACGTAVTPVASFNTVPAGTLTASPAAGAKGSGSKTWLYIIIAAAVVVGIVVGVVVARSVGNGGSTDDTEVVTQTLTPVEESTDDSEDGEDSDSDDSESSGSSDSGASEEENANDNQGDGYILPDSDTRVYSQDELSAMSNEELYFARNEIFARHGRGFKSQDLQDYFNTKSWYHMQYSPDEFSDDLLNETEKKNAENMLAIEKDRNSPYIQ